MHAKGLWVGLVALALALGCDRNIEPYDPAEEPREPDLSRIFPEGATRAAQARPGMPPAPGQGGPPMPGAPAAPSAAGPGSDAPPVTGTLRLAEGLTPPPGGVLFLIARRGGAGPPLAVKRIPDPEFPLEFSLGPEDRMIQAMPFAGPLTLSARVDGDGDASSREPGDLQGALADPVDPGASGIELLLDETL